MHQIVKAILSRNCEVLVVTAIIIISAFMIGHWAIANDMITYRQDSGESYIAFDQASKAQNNFSQYGLLHVEDKLDGTKLVYTHNVNIGTHYALFLRLFGATNLRAFLWLILPLFFLALIIAYLAIRAISGSQFTALVFLILMVSDFGNVGAFAFNALRSWHYLGLFSALLGIFLLLNRKNASEKLKGYFFLLLGSIVAFGCGYDFYVIVGASTVLFALLFPDKFPGFRMFFIIGAFFALPFVVRQAEVIFWLGLDFWVKDFFYSLAIKVPFFTHFISIPSLGEVDAYYASLGVMRPPAVPSKSWSNIWDSLVPLLIHATAPRYGILTLILIPVGVIWGLANRLLASRFTRDSGMRLCAAMSLGALIGLSIFAPFSFQVYLKHNFPLIAGLVHLTTAIILVKAFQMLFAEWKWPLRFKTLFAAAITGLLLLNIALVRKSDHETIEGLSFQWIKSLDRLMAERGLAKEKVLAAATGIPLPDDSAVKAVPVFRNSTQVDPSRILEILAESDAINSNTQNYRALNERLLVYSPGHNWCNIDSPEPDLSQKDWLMNFIDTRFFKKIEPQWFEKNTVGFHCGNTPTQPIHPDDVLKLSYMVEPHISSKLGAAARVRLDFSDSAGKCISFYNGAEEVKRSGGKLPFISTHSSFNNILQLSIPSGTLQAFNGNKVNLQVIYFNEFGQSYVSSPISITVSENAPRNRQKMPVFLPTIDTVVRMFPNIPVVEKQPSYIIFRLPSNKEAATILNK